MGLTYPIYSRSAIQAKINGLKIERIVLHKQWTALDLAKLDIISRLHFDQEAIDSNEEFQGLAAQQNKIREELEKVKGKIGEFKERLKSDDLDDKVAG